MRKINAKDSETLRKVSTTTASQGLQKKNTSAKRTRVETVRVVSEKQQ